MNDDSEEEYKGEAQADECVPEGEEAMDEGELVWMSGECPPETAAQFWMSVAAYEQAPPRYSPYLLRLSICRAPACARKGLAGNFVV